MPSIYRYFGAKNAHEALGLLVDLVENNVLWASSPLGFNDPLELKINVRPTRDHRRLRTTFLNAHPNATESEFQQFLNSVIQPECQHSTENGIRRNMSQLCRIVCFSEEHDNRLMWSHYSGSHKSFCAEFDRDILATTSNPKPRWMESVKYRKTPPVFDYTTSFMDFLPLLIGTKDEEWGYEKEHRFIYLLAAPKDGTPLSGTSNDVPASLKIKFNRSALKKIILGCRAFPILLDYANSRSSVTSLSWAMINQSDDKYALRLCPLPRS